MKYENVKIIILAAGKSTRMKSDEPKALTILKGRPFIHHILDTIKSLDPKIKPIIVIGHKKERIKEVLGEGHIYAEQKEQLGTGHAVISAKNAIDLKDEIIIVLSADQPLVSKETLELLIKKHLEKKGAITMGTVMVPDFKDWRVPMYKDFGRIVRGNNGQIKKIVEFKDTNEEEKKITELNPALYLFNAKWLWDNIGKIKNDNAQNEYILTDIVKIAYEQNDKIETTPIANIIEAIQPNSPEGLKMLEELIKSMK